MPIEFTIVHFFHIVFVAWGLGGATVATILMMKAEKDPALAPSSMRMIEPVSKLIWVAIIGLIVTGIITASMGAGKGYYDATILAVKHIAVAILIIDGLNITFRLLPKLRASSPQPGMAPLPEFLKSKRHLKISSIISLVLWYLIVALSVTM